MILEVNSLEDVEIFAKQMVEEGVNIHPDDDFYNIINLETDKRCYTDDEALLRNLLMSQCFLICEQCGADIYDIMNRVFLIETGFSKFIPLPPGY